MAETVIKTILEASLTAGIAAIAVMLIRIPMKKSPKRWSYMLWAVVFFRCLCPFSVESAVSLFNIVPKQDVPDQDVSSEISGIVYDTSDRITDHYDNAAAIYDDPAYVDYSGNADFNRTYPYENSDTENTENSVDPAAVIFAVWVSGVSVMTLYAVISYAGLRKKLKTAIRTEDGVYETDLISTAFSAGFFPPKIYIPRSFSAKERELIIAHERVHIKRLDYITNPLAFAGLAIHWFNPLIWIAYAFMTKDMELSCDEAVLEILGSEEKKAYSETLLQVSIRQNGFVGFPPAFAETEIKERVKNVLGYKKPGIISTVIAVAIVIAVCAVLGTNAVKEPDIPAENDPDPMTETDNAESADNNMDSVFLLRGEPYYYYNFSDKEKTSLNGEIENIDSSRAVKLGSVDYYEYDKPCLVSVSRFKSGDRTRYLWDETSIIFDFDDSKVKNVTIKNIEITKTDGQTYIAGEAEFQFTEYYQWLPLIELTNKSAGWFMAGSSPGGGCEISFEIPVPAEPSDNYTYSEFSGYGILLCGFENAEIYIGDDIQNETILSDENIHKTVQQVQRENESHIVNRYTTDATPDEKIYIPQKSLINGDTVTKENIWHMMLNTIDYYNYASGTVIYANPGIITCAIIVEFQSDMQKAEAYSHFIQKNVSADDVNRAVKNSMPDILLDNSSSDNCLSDREVYCDSGHIITVNYINKTYEKEDYGTITRANSGSIADDDRYGIDENGIPWSKYRANPTNVWDAGICLFPQDVTIGFLNDFDMWTIDGSDIYNGRDCIVVSGKAPENYGKKLGVDKFIFHVDRETGVLLKYVGYDENENISDYMISSNISFDNNFDIESKRTEIAKTAAFYSKAE